MSMTEPLPVEGDTTWYDWATAIHAVADTALQPADVGTAAAEDVGYFATAAQGAAADTALQSVDIADINATGTPDGTTVLYGDGTWAVPAGTGSTDAADINIADAGTLYNATEVEAALAEVKAIADSATQPGDLGTAAVADTGDFATAAQGTTADAAVEALSTITKLYGPITQAAYAGLTPDADTLYVIVG